MMKNTSLRIWATDTYCAIPLLLRIGTVQGSSDICILPVQIQRYISIYSYAIMTPVVVTLYYWWHLSEHKLWSKCIWAPDFINHIHQLRFVMRDCWTSMNNYWWETTTSVVPRAIDTCPCRCGRCQLAKWPRYDLIRKQNLVYIYPRWW